MIYFDAAYVAKFYLDEPDSTRVRALAEEAGEVACCRHGQVEVLIAFHRKLRERAFSPKIFAAVCDQFEADCKAAVWAWLPISAKLIESLSERIRQLDRSASSVRPMRFIWRARPNKVSRISTPMIAISSLLPPTSLFAA